MDTGFNDHVRIKKIKESYVIIIPNAFTFSPVSLGDRQKEIMNLDVKKPSSSTSIPVIIFKQSAHIYLTFSANSIVNSLFENTFPDELKQSEVVPLHKNLDLL